LTKKLAASTLIPMNALIITGGEGPAPSFLMRLARDSDLIIAADSGLQAAESAGISPRYIIGDFDSLDSPERLEKYDKKYIIQHPKLKDDTDTELALELARRSGASRIRIAGGGEGRMDHLIAILYLFHREFPPREWHCPEDSIYLLEPEEAGRFAAAVGGRVSVFPLSAPSGNMDSEGLLWPLSGLAWESGRFGVSNAATAEEVRIKAGDARLLVILPLGCERLDEHGLGVAGVLD